MLSIKGKDDYNNIEAQLREYQRKMESMSRDISNKDSLNRQLKNKIKTLEDDFEQSRQDLNSCIISRDSLQQQKLDVERELKVNIYVLYICLLLRKNIIKYGLYKENHFVFIFSKKNI